MKVRVIGCHGGMSPDYNTTSYLVNDRFLIDAGSICSELNLEEQKKISDILITHTHLDHIKDICFLLENTFAKDRAPLRLYSSKQNLEALKQHVFNDLIWPDFTKIEISDGQPFLELVPLEDQLNLGGVEISSFKVNHPANAIGYILNDGDVQVIFTGDTGPHKKIWDIANDCKNLKAVFTEVSFPSRMQSLAKASGHFTLQQLKDDLNTLRQKDTPIYIGHFKPLFLKELIDEFNSDALENMKPLHADDEFHFV